MKTPIPYGPHFDSVGDPRLGMSIPAAGIVIVYCPRHACAAMYQVASDRWLISTPIEAVDFLKMLESRHFELPTDAVEA